MKIVYHIRYQSVTFRLSERSAMAAQDAGLLSALHLEGGLDAWKKAQGPVGR